MFRHGDTYPSGCFRNLISHQPERMRGGSRLLVSPDEPLDVWRKHGHFSRAFAQVVGIGSGPARINAHVAAVGPAQLLQPLQERANAGLTFRIVSGPGDK